MLDSETVCLPKIFGRGYDKTNGIDLKTGNNHFSSPQMSVPSRTEMSASFRVEMSGTFRKLLAYTLVLAILLEDVSITNNAKISMQVFW
jgi:hypothetical protein